MSLPVCPSCGVNNRVGACSCIGCGVKLGSCRAAHPAAALLGLVMSGCVGDKIPDAQPPYGLPDTEAVDDSSTRDRDGDGFSPSTGDCNDDDPAVHPGAEDPIGDGLDTDCDNEDG